MADIVDKFEKRMTNIGVVVRESDEAEKELPCFTAWGPCYTTLFVRNLRIFVIS
jgi:hypothetical protein